MLQVLQPFIIPSLHLLVLIKVLDIWKKMSRTEHTGHLYCLNLFSLHFDQITRFFQVFLDMNCFFFSTTCLTLAILLSDIPQLPEVDYILDELCQPIYIWFLSRFLFLDHKWHVRGLQDHLQIAMIGSWWQEHGMTFQFISQIGSCHVKCPKEKQEG